MKPFQNSASNEERSFLSKLARVSKPAVAGLALAAIVAVSPVVVRADNQGGSVTTPLSTRQQNARGLKTAVVAATDTGGDIDVAFRALKAANIAMMRQPGYAVMSPSDVSTRLKKANLRWPFAPRDYERVRKELDKANRVLSVEVTPLEVTTGGNPGYSSVVELYDTNTGALVGRGEGSYVATPDSQPLTIPMSMAPADSKAVVGSFEVPAGTDMTSATVTQAPAESAQPTMDDLKLLAVDGAILNAVEQMNEPATLTGIVISKPAGHVARLSLGTMQGLRNGARIEYLVKGRAIAWGTAYDVGPGESLASVAPERNFPFIETNMAVRTVNIPPIGLAGRSRVEIQDKEWKNFERDFGIGAAIAGVAYLIFS